jgi:hypothetical protein
LCLPKQTPRFFSGVTIVTGLIMLNTR